MTKLLLAAVVLVAALVVAGCGAVGHEEFQSSSAAQGKKLFASNCGGCHTLKDAGTSGTTGPNLDDAWVCAHQQGFKRSTWRDVVRGQIDYASPPMPRELVKGADADAVADYVSDNAGRGMSCSGNAQPKTAGQ